MTKKRIITLVVAIIGIAATIYAVSIATKNFAILALSPLLLGFLACPLMCGVMGGGLWLVGKFTRNKQKAGLRKNTGACCHHGNHHDNGENRDTGRNRNKSGGKFKSINTESNKN